MTWKRMSITIFLLIVFLNILQINIFLIFVFNSQSPGASPGGLRSDTIASIWFWEMILGVILLMVGGMILIFSRKRKKPSIVTRSLQRSKGSVTVVSTTGFNHISPFYRLEIENKTKMPIIDVTLDPILTEDSFDLDEKQKTIPVIRSNGKRYIKFGLKPKEGKSGETIFKGHVKYLNLEIDEYEEIPFEPKTIKIKWPNLSKDKIELEEWDRVSKSLISADEKIRNIPLSGPECTKFVKGIAKSNKMSIISTEIKEDPYASTTKIHSKDDEDAHYTAKFIVTSLAKDESISHLDINVFGAKKETLAGFYFIIYNEIEKGLPREAIPKDKVSKRAAITPEISKMVMEGMGIQRDIFEEFDRLRTRVETIEKDKIGIDSQYTSLYELDELYKILAEDLVKRRIVDVKAGEEIVKKRMEKKYLEELKKFTQAYALLCEAETSDSLLMRKDFPDSGKKAILLVYFNALEVYLREKLKGLIPKGVTVLLGETHGHINTRKKDWEKSWSVLGLGSCIHVINRNKYLFLKNEELWKHKVETLMHQVREMRNTVAHPSKENPDPSLVRDKVYQLFTLLPDVLQSNE